MDKNITRLSILFLIAALLAASGFLYDSFQLAKAFSYMTAALAVLLIAAFSQNKMPLSAPVFLAAAYWLYVSVQLAATPHKPPVYYTLTMLAPAGFFAALSLENGKKHMLVFINIACALSSALLFYQLAKNPSARPYSFFGNPIFFAEFIAINFPLILASGYFFGDKKPLIAANSLLCFFSLLLSGSRGAFISLAVSSLFFSIFMLRLKPQKPGSLLKNTLLVLVPALAVWLALFFHPATSTAMKNSVSRAAGIFSLKNRAIADRVLILKTALEMSKPSLAFGRGPGAFRQLYQQYQAPLLRQNPAFSFLTTSYAHNDYMQLVAEFGTAGLLLYLLFFLSLFLRFDAGSGSMPEEQYVFRLAMAAAVLSFFTEGFFNFPLFIMPAAGLFWLYAGFMHGSSREKSGATARPGGFYAAAALPALLALVLCIKPLVSNFYLKQGVNAMGSGANTEMDFLSRAAELDPAGYYAYFYSGLSLSKKYEYEKSAWYYKRALDVYPASADAIYNIAACLRATGSLEEAKHYYLRALELYPGFILARLNLGKTCIDLGMEQEGIKEISEARKIDAGYADAEIQNQVVDFVEATWEFK